MALPATDNFNRADAANLGSNWTGQITDPIIEANTAGCNNAASNFHGAWWNADSFNADQYSECTRGAGGNYSAVSVRASGTGSDMGFYAYFNDGEVIRARPAGLGGGQTTLATLTTYTNGDLVRISITGTTITVSKNGTPNATQPTDSVLASGAAGLAFYNNGVIARMDNWTGDNVASGGGGTIIDESISVGARGSITPMQATAMALSASLGTGAGVAPNQAGAVALSTAADIAAVVAHAAQQAIAKSIVLTMAAENVVSIQKVIEASIAAASVQTLAQQLATGVSASVGLISVGALTPSVLIDVVRTLSLASAGNVSLTLSLIVEYAAAMQAVCDLRVGVPFDVDAACAMGATVAFSAAGQRVLALTAALDSLLAYASTSNASVSREAAMAVVTDLTRAISLIASRGVTLSPILNLAPSAQRSLTAQLTLQASALLTALLGSGITVTSLRVVAEELRKLAMIQGEALRAPITIEEEEL